MALTSPWVAAASGEQHSRLTVLHLAFDPGCALASPWHTVPMTTGTWESGKRESLGGGCEGSSTGQFCDTDNSDLVATATGQANIAVPTVEIAISMCLPSY